ncbi:hypothetical protein ABZZ20_31560 [Streptomyces sp. NPDC006430]|uniref:hypothetical protein n=1 Tax=Streptomyces sp. NPDC006430 TaxID=3154299 RepID=UPI0033A137DB
MLVDDLDEHPTADERRAVLEKLANAVAADPPLYRCVVATRPLTENELNVLDRILGRQVPHHAYASLLTSIVEDSTESDCTRALSAWTLAGLDGHEQAGATWLARFIGSAEPPRSAKRS